MQFGMWDTLLNGLLFLFWFKLWNRPVDRALRTNPYLWQLQHTSDRFVQFLSPVFFGAPVPVIGVVALVFLIVFRATAVPAGANWILHIGFVGGAADPSSFRNCLSFSSLSFAAFLFYLWGISLIYVRDAHSSSFRHTTETVFAMARPFTSMPPAIRPFVLLVFGMLLAAGLKATGEGFGPVLSETGRLIAVARYAIASITGWVNVLLVLTQCVVLLILGSWVSTLGSSPSLLFLCHDWMDMLLGRMRRFPVRIGILDLTPVVFLFLLTAVYVALIKVLSQGYNALPTAL